MPSKADILARRDRIQELEDKGITSARKLAAEIGVSLRTVYLDLAAMNAAWAERSAERRDAYKRRLVMRAERRYRELESEWERSKSDKQRQKAKETSAKGGPGVEAEPIRVETEAATEGRLGEAAFQREMRENDKFIADILELIKSKHELTGADGGAIPVALVREVVVRTREEAKGILDSDKPS